MFMGNWENMIYRNTQVGGCFAKKKAALKYDTLKPNFQHLLGKLRSQSELNVENLSGLLILFSIVGLIAFSAGAGGCSL